MATRSAAAKKVAAKKLAARPAAKKPAPKPAARPATPTQAPVETPAQTPAQTPKKAKLVRDSFTMPQVDFDLIGVLKERALGFKRPVKKSELLRAGLRALAGLNDAALQAALNALPPLKPGRPRKGG